MSAGIASENGFTAAPGSALVRPAGGSTAAGVLDRLSRTKRSRQTDLRSIAQGRSSACHCNPRPPIQAHPARTVYDPPWHARRLRRLARRTGTTTDFTRKNRPSLVYAKTSLKSSRWMKSSTAVSIAFSFWRSAGAQDMTGIEIGIVSDCLHCIHGEPVADPVCATLLGPTRVIPKELPGLTCRGIDIDLGTQGPAQAADQIIAELCTPFRESVVAMRRGERWIESLEPAELRSSVNFGRLRKNGVYLITGGLGDLGLVIAEELAREFEARLVLLGRTPLVPAQEWRHALKSSDTPDRLKPRIAKLVELESLGAEILYIPCDVSRRNEMKRAIDTARARFGAIHGVIHAAGVIDDGPLLIKSRASAASVLDPKVKGTLVLIDVLTAAMADTTHNEPLDFIALFSSVSSLSAPAGQVDYIAANSFLNAFAASRRDVRVVAINWDAWRDVGMAARASTAHPLLGRRLVDTGSEIVYKATLCRERHWMLAEHCLKTGQAVLPGTGYLEMASAALTNGSFDQGVAFEDVFFQSPFLADPAQSREALVDLNRTHNGTFQFSVRTGDHGSIEHASGRIERCHKPPPGRVALEAIRARCQSRLCHV